MKPQCKCLDCTAIRAKFGDDFDNLKPAEFAERFLKVMKDTPKSIDGQVVVRYLGPEKPPEELHKAIEQATKGIVAEYLNKQQPDPEEDVWGDGEDTIEPPEQQTAFVEEQVDEFQDIDIAVNIGLLKSLETQVEAMRLQAWALTTQMDATQELLQALKEEAGL
jgi:hypothetical protein